MIAESFAEAEDYRSALAACDMVLKADPDNSELLEFAKDLSAKGTIKQGKYDTDGSFTESGPRHERADGDVAARSPFARPGFLEEEIANARTKYESAPATVAGINSLVDALLKVEEDGYENEAIDILVKAHSDSGEYRYKVRADDVRMRQMRRRYKAMKADERQDDAARVGS